MQLGGASKQFSLGKSYSGFAPIGPVMVSHDELADRDNIELGCSVNGVVMQNSSTNLMIFPVPELVSRLSHICALYPGDLIFTGTPAGMGMTMTPPRYLEVGDVVESWVEGVGRLRNRCVTPVTPAKLSSAKGNTL
jgi:2,4-diketo-3-deoxy-L-fuconate hydrolase